MDLPSPASGTDWSLQLRTSLSIQHITTLLEFSLKIPSTSSKVSIMNMYMRSCGISLSPIVVNLFMEKFKVKDINSVTHPSRLWPRCVDDLFVIEKAKHGNQFVQHINSIDPHIQFAQEMSNTQSSILFLDTLVSSGPDNTLLTTVYRKPDDTDQYLHWDIQHNLSAKYNVFKPHTQGYGSLCSPTSYCSRNRNTSGRL